MHSVHLPEDGVNKDGYFGAVMGLVFDTMRYDPTITEDEVDIIDAFFDSMKWDALSIDAGTGGAVQEVNLDYVNYGQLMNIAKTQERFIYTGSLTTPPCTEKVFWNVINKVYPIKPRHLAQFQYLIQQQGRTDESKGKMTYEGNYREIQSIKKQDPKLMVVDPEEEEGDIDHTNRVLTIVLVVVLVKVLIVSGIIFMILNNQDSQDSKNKQMQFQKRSSLYEDKEIEFGPSSRKSQTGGESARRFKSGGGIQGKQSSGNFGSDPEDSEIGDNAAPSRLEQNMNRGKDGDPTPTQVMKGHENGKK